jgi:hypothetical protein
MQARKTNSSQKGPNTTSLQTCRHRTAISQQIARHLPAENLLHMQWVLQQRRDMEKCTVPLGIMIVRKNSAG